MKAVRFRPALPGRVRGDAGKLVRDTRTEIRKITWPSREDVVRLTIVVVLLSLAMAFFLGIVVDGLFGFLYRQLVGL